MKDSFRHALVIGKFYPPHRGHEYLIRTAALAAREVTVVAMAADHETIALSFRVEWLKEILSDVSNATVVGVVDNVRVDYEDDGVWAQHVELMKHGVALAERMRRTAAGAIDAVFTSEAYGDELARRFDAVSICVDPSRALHPVSGTAVRRDPVASWNDIAPSVRGFLCQRVVIVGAESTGKTTLAAALAERLRQRGGVWERTQWVAEFGREYTIAKLAIEGARARQNPDDVVDVLRALRWASAEFETIALEQQRREDDAARTAGPVLVCDTDAFATAVWHERYVGTRSTAVESIAARAPARLGYILAAHEDVPFEQDGLRDGEHLRTWMNDAFAARLQGQVAPWIRVTGTLEQRLAQSLSWIDERLERAWRFAPPLG